MNDKKYIIARKFIAYLKREQLAGWKIIGPQKEEKKQS